MSNEQVSQQTSSSNRNYIIIGSIFGFLALLVVGFILFTFLQSTSPSEAGGSGNANGGSSSGSELTVDDVPLFEGFTANVNPNSPSTVDVEFTILQPEGELVVEYELLDVNRKSVIKSSTNDTITIAETVNLANGVNSFTLRLRVTDGLTYSPWRTSEPLTVEATVNIPGVGVETEPNPAYFDTGWANGEASPVAFEEAMRVAWDATLFNAGVDACLVLNEATLSPGEMIPPVPSGLPENVVLKYFYESSTGDGNPPYYMSFLWCEQF